MRQHLLMVPAVGLLALLLLPLLGLAAASSPAQLVEALGLPSTRTALVLTLWTTAVALVLIVLLGTPLAWWLSRARGRAARLATLIVELPVVLPPAVLGVALLQTFGRRGLFGPLLESVGLSLPFTPAAVVLAQLMVGAPLFVLTATAAFRSVDDDALLVARTLGAGPLRAWFTVALPTAAIGLVAGAGLAWARALGEFGATLMFAGNLPGRTQTLTLAVFQALEQDVAQAQAISLVLVVVAASLLVGLRLGLPPEPGVSPPVLELRCRLTLGDFDLDVDLALPAGPIALVGPNGAGKTCLLRVLAGALTPDQGRVAVAGRVLVDTDAGLFLPPEHRGVGYLPQGLGLFGHLSALDNVAYGLHRLPRVERRQRAQAQLDALGIGALAHRRPLRLSGGERQRVALARALAIHPALLLLDEPTSALDVTVRQTTRSLLRPLLHDPARLGVVVTHDLRDLVAWDPVIVLLEAGRVTTTGRLADLRSHTLEPFLRELLLPLDPG